MREVFYEESSFKQRRSIDKFLYYLEFFIAIALFCFAFFWLIGNIFDIKFTSEGIINAILFVLLPSVLAVVSGVFLIKLSSNLGVDFDYTFISGTIKVAKIIMDSRRIFVIEFDVSDIEKIGKVNSNSYNSFTQNNAIKTEELTAKTIADDNKSFYYLLINHDGEKKMLVFECTNMFIKTILSYTNKRLLEEDFNQ